MRALTKRCVQNEVEIAWNRYVKAKADYESNSDKFGAFNEKYENELNESGNQYDLIVDWAMTAMRLKQKD